MSGDTWSEINLMCGIAIHFNSLGKACPLDLSLIHHRGPDSQGEWMAPDGRVWLGNTRLAIVDLSPTGAQPMTDPTNGNVIVINGEIYNHRALREELGDAVEWVGTSDTETVLRAYGKWGRGVLGRLKGMFAFAIYDAARRELLVARDRLGIKPLYSVCDENGVRFASEARMLESGGGTISAAAVSGYLQWGACPERQLLYPDLRVLPAGHALVIGAEGASESWRYWPDRAAFVSPAENAAAEVRRRLEVAVDEHLLADVPVASFLSGGIDSSIVTALAAQRLEKKLHTYSVGFDLADFDESPIALEVAQRYGTEHHRILLSEQEVIECVTEAVEKLDLPSADAINTYIVSRAVARHGVKVALSGLGGDELFGGYPSFRDLWKLQWLARTPRFLRRLLGPRVADIPATTVAGELARWRRRFFTDDTLRAAGLPEEVLPFECPVQLPDDFARVSWAELTGYMRRMLLRDADQMSMAVSLEMRVPFLDHELVEYVLGLPAAEKRRGRLTKSLLVESCRDLLPVSVYDRPKRGFALPMGVWMRGPLESFVNAGLKECVTRALLPGPFVDQQFQAFRRGRLSWTRLWSLVVLGHFAQRHDLHGDENPPLHPHR